MGWYGPGDRFDEPSAAELALGREVRRSRHALGLSQRGLAARSGISQSTISRLERGRTPKLHLERFAALISALGWLASAGARHADHDDRH